MAAAAAACARGRSRRSPRWVGAAGRTPGAAALPRRGAPPLARAAGGPRAAPVAPGRTHLCRSSAGETPAPWWGPRCDQGRARPRAAFRIGARPGLNCFWTPPRAHWRPERAYSARAPRARGRRAGNPWPRPVRPRTQPTRDSGGTWGLYPLGGRAWGWGWGVRQGGGAWAAPRRHPPALQWLTQRGRRRSRGSSPSAAKLALTLGDGRATVRCGSDGTWGTEAWGVAAGLAAGAATRGDGGAPALPGAPGPAHTARACRGRIGRGPPHCARVRVAPRQRGGGRVRRRGGRALGGARRARPPSFLPDYPLSGSH
jgi:hypothetical protein